MTLPVSGNSIKMSQVDTELNLSSTAQLNLGASSVRTLFGVASGQISLSNGYGKQNIPAVILSGWQYPVYSFNGTSYSSSNWPTGLGSTAGTPPGSNGPYTWTAVAFGNGKYVAVTSSYPTTKIASTTDGVNWIEPATSPINAAYVCGCFMNGTFFFIAAAGGANFITSTDGVNWTARTLSNANVATVNTGNGVAIMPWTSPFTAVFRSTDLINWSSISTSPYTISSPSYGNGKWIGFAYNVNNGAQSLAVSTDNGQSWSTQADPSGRVLRSNGSGPVGNWNGTIWGDPNNTGTGIWFLYSGTASSSYSTDGGSTWTNIMLPSPNASYLPGAAYSAKLKLFIIGDLQKGVITSSDCVNWTYRSMPTTSMNGSNPKGIAVAT